MPKNTANPRFRLRGFTMIELLITMAIMAIGLALAYPSFTQTIRSNRVATGTNSLIAAFNLARTEAIRSNRGGGACPSSNGTTCAASGGWQQGWLIWTDLDGNGEFSGGEPVIRYFQASAGLDITSAAKAVVFDHRGRLSPAIGIALAVKSDPCPTGQKLLRNFTISPIGQIRFATSPCP